MQSDSIVYKFYYQWWKNIDKSIFLLISLLFVIGLFFSLVSTSLIASDKLDTNSYFFFFKHLIYVLIGISLIFIFSSLNSDQLYKYSIILFFVSLISLFLVPFIGVEVKGSKRWIDLFFLPRFQPIEVLKPFLIIILATILCDIKSNILFSSILVGELIFGLYLKGISLIGCFFILKISNIIACNQEEPDLNEPLQITNILMLITIS
mgnify:CR=1 FL=1